MSLFRKYSQFMEGQMSLWISVLFKSNWQRWCVELKVRSEFFN